MAWGKAPVKKSEEFLSNIGLYIHTEWGYKVYYISGSFSFTFCFYLSCLRIIFQFMAKATLDKSFLVGGVLLVKKYPHLMKFVIIYNLFLMEPP